MKEMDSAPYDGTTIKGEDRAGNRFITRFIEGEWRDATHYGLGSLLHDQIYRPILWEPFASASGSHTLEL